MANEFELRILDPEHRNEAALRKYCKGQLIDQYFSIHAANNPLNPGVNVSFLVPNRHGWMVWRYDKDLKWKVRPDRDPTNIFGNPQQPEPISNGLARDHGYGILVGVYNNDGVLDAYPVRWGSRYYVYEDHPNDDGFRFFYNTETSPEAPKKSVSLFANDSFHDGHAHAYTDNTGIISFSIAVFPYFPTPPR
jgi:hypothetical protein